MSNAVFVRSGPAPVLTTSGGPDRPSAVAGESPKGKGGSRFPPPTPTKEADCTGRIVQMIADEQSRSYGTYPVSILKPGKPVDEMVLQGIQEQLQRWTSLPKSAYRRMVVFQANHADKLAQDADGCDSDSTSTTSSWGSPPASVTSLDLQADRQAKEPDGFVHVRKTSFSPLLKMGLTYSRAEYNRTGVESEAKRMSPALVLAIRAELNAFKASMRVHPQSTHNTLYYPVPESYCRPPALVLQPHFPFTRSSMPPHTAEMAMQAVAECEANVQVGAELVGGTGLASLE